MNKCERTRKLLIMHYQAYPKLQIQDIFKFLYPPKTLLSLKVLIQCIPSLKNSTTFRWFWTYPTNSKENGFCTEIHPSWHNVFSTNGSHLKINISEKHELNSVVM